MLNIWLFFTKKCTYREILSEAVIGCVKECLLDGSNLMLRHLVPGDSITAFSPNKLQ